MHVPSNSRAPAVSIAAGCTPVKVADYKAARTAAMGCTAMAKIRRKGLRKRKSAISFPRLAHLHRRPERCRCRRLRCQDYLRIAVISRKRSITATTRPTDMAFLLPALEGIGSGLLGSAIGGSVGSALGGNAENAAMNALNAQD